jgi:uncharacterized protein YndB with AHSA1/START domain
MTRTEVPVVRKQVVVKAPVEQAFTTFTGRFGDFKPPEHNLLAAAVGETVFEPRAGGHIYDRAVDGSECRWARILAYEPPGRVVFSWDISPQWQIETDPELTSEVEVRFVAEGPDRTRVELEHRGRGVRLHHRSCPLPRVAAGCHRRPPGAARPRAGGLEVPDQSIRRESPGLESQGPQAYVQETGAECAGRAGNHPFGDGRAVLRTEILSGPDNGGSGPGEPFDESSAVSRSVIGTLGQSSRKRNWGYGNRADVLPELTLILHLPFALPLNIANFYLCGPPIVGHTQQSASDRGWIYGSCPHPARRSEGALGGWHPHPGWI